MTIEPIVRDTAAHFGVDPALIQAVIAAEGNILRAVQCSMPSVTTREQAIEITCRSAVHAMSDYVKAHAHDAFVEAWAKRWAPVGVANDPTALNQFWGTNVKKGWK